MAGKLYVLGVGPGDPELMTIKAARILREVSCICVPKGKEDGTSLALSIVSKAIDLEGKEVLEAYFPMRKTEASFGTGDLDRRWNEAVTALTARLNRGTDTAFITIGDPGIYSTFFYLYNRLLHANPELRIEIVPGVSSINAAAAKAGLSLGLGDERIAILPANYLNDLASTLEQFDTVVLMKVYKVFNEVVAILNRLDMLKQAIYVSRAGMADEVVHRDLPSIKPDDLDYFSLIIVKKQQGIKK